MNILAYITDLFFQAQVTETAQAAGVNVNIVSSLYHFLPKLREEPSMVLIDLDAQGINPGALISQIKEAVPHLPVVVYSEHVEEDKIEQARQSGADHVLPKSEFAKNLKQVLKDCAPTNE
jgi:CheY-like chemotaxis protein